jgi:phosphoglycerate dehydrogenase-like enzyme
MADEQINVLITYRWQIMDEALVQRIRAVSPRLNVSYALSEEDDQRYLPTTDILFTIPLPSDMQLAPRLKWVQLLSAGYEHLHGHPIEGTSIVVTNASGIHGIPISEYVLTVMMMLSRKLNLILATENADTLWQPFQFVGRELYGATIGVIGVGSIGREIARLASAFGMRVIGVDSRSPDVLQMPGRYLQERDSIAMTTEGAAFDFLPADQLDYLLAESDFVVLAVPHTQDTHHLINTERLQKMKPSAFLINPARGALVDDDALLEALESGWIAGAALDAFEPEPLAAEHPYYQMPNVLVTPHMSGHTDRLFERCVDVFCANLDRYLKGEALLNQVHPRKA